MSEYGYIRVSSKDQNEARQLIEMRKRSISNSRIYCDKQSGKDFERPAFQKLMKILKKGDVLYTLSIDRLGRNYKEIMEQWRIITKEKEADIVIIDMPLLDTTKCRDLLGTFISDIVLQLLSFVAQNERENIRRRQAEGIAAAKARGVRFGNVPKEKPDNFTELYSKWSQKEININEFMFFCNVSRTTLYKWIKNYKEEISSCVE